MAEMAKEEMGGGNTKLPPKKRISPANKWCFTLNNYTSEEMAELANLFRGINCDWIIGKEVGDSGTPHLQGFIFFHAKGGIRPMEKVKNKRIHWEKCKGTKEQNIIYCKKDGNFFFGGSNIEQWIKDIELKTEVDNYRVTMPKYQPWMGNILKIISDPVDYRKMYWFWDKHGNIGKTEFQKYLFTNYERVIILGGSSMDMKNGIVDYHKKNGYHPKTILINIPKSSRSKN
ncbi:replication protein [uncultured marine virus]|nr:replication protein [uncultured marine virus]